jgi:deoxyribodipyrimidine photo-lyase
MNPPPGGQRPEAVSLGGDPIISIVRTTFAIRFPVFAPTTVKVPHLAMSAPVLLWFRQDLRLADHRALAAALAAKRPIIPVYILDDETPGMWRLGGASRWWLRQSLAALNQDLERLGSRLVLRRGAAEAMLLELINETGAEAVHVTRRYEPWASDLDRELAVKLEKKGIDFKRFAGSLLFEPEALRTKAGDPFKVFTPFYKACLALDPPKPPLPRPEALPSPQDWPGSDDPRDWALLPTAPDWSGGLQESWQPGENGAEARLEAFLDDAMTAYAENRDRPDLIGTSRLSPHLHHGEISPHRCWQAIDERLAAAGDSRGERGGRSYLRELVWREFSYHLLAHWPDLPEKAFRPEFEHFPWETDEQTLKAWQLGKTGYPIVDAGMRELWQTGWMHNRVRMVTASFLIKHLMIPWQAGEAWFWDTLVDADLASNAASWQWVAGSGADAAPYFRIFNPILQGKKFDPEGDYVKRYVPELAGLPPDHIHAPWEAPKASLAEAGVDLGKTYPLPIVGHGKARERALQAYGTIKKS